MLKQKWNRLYIISKALMEILIIFQIFGAGLQIKLFINIRFFIDPLLKKDLLDKELNAI